MGTVMEAFEIVVGEILSREGYWVRNALKVELTKEEKREIGRPSSPRWEIDLVGYSACRKELVVVECKSYLDSSGVAYRALVEPNLRFAQRFKLFNEEKLRQVVFDRLHQQMVDAGLIPEETTVKLALAGGKIVSDGDREKIREHFDDRGWYFWDDEWIRRRLKAISKEGYENSSVAIVSKLLLRTKDDHTKCRQ